MPYAIRHTPYAIRHTPHATHTHTPHTTFSYCDGGEVAFASQSPRFAVLVTSRRDKYSGTVVVTHCRCAPGWNFPAIIVCWKPPKQCLVTTTYHQLCPPTPTVRVSKNMHV